MIPPNILVMVPLFLSSEGGTYWWRRSHSSSFSSCFRRTDVSNISSLLYAGAVLGTAWDRWTVSGEGGIFTAVEVAASVNMNHSQFIVKL